MRLPVVVVHSGVGEFQLMASRAHPANAVVITGLGAFTAVGPTVQDLWEAVRVGRTQAQWHEFNGQRIPVCAAADPELEAPELRRLRRMDRSIQFAGVAAWEAWNDAGLIEQAPAPERIAIFAGTSRGPLGTVLDSQRAHAAGERIRPSVAPNSTIGCLSGSLSTVFGARGPCLTISVACASGAAALALAAQQILSGTVDVALAGGAEAPLCDLILAQLQSARVLASHHEPRLACRPFDSARNGTVIGEGAAFLVLESLASARQRGARIYARLAGWAIGSEGSERTGISEESECLRRNMSEALAMAQLPVEALGYINAHGTGTDLNDRMEACAISKAFAGSRKDLATSSTKAVTGHCLGATAAIEAVISVLALEHQCLPPTANCFEQAADCPIELVLGQAKDSAFTAALSNSAAFWGNNASLLFRIPTR